MNASGPDSSDFSTPAARGFYTKILVIVAVAVVLYTFTFSSSSYNGAYLSPSSFDSTAEWKTFHSNQGYTSSPDHIEQFFPPPDPERKDYHEWNAKTLRDLHTCMALENCHPNQQKIALLAAHWFEEAIVRGWRGGEGIWGLSVYKHLRALGYTTLFANSFEEALTQYRMFPDLVKVVIRNKAGECHSSPTCVKGPSNPTGIPAWKIFDFEFFASHGGHFHASLMRGKWILSANPDDAAQPRYGLDQENSPIQYIGYSIEDSCSLQPLIPFTQRPKHAWLLMKQLTYIHPIPSSDNPIPWNLTHLLPNAATELGITFVGAWQVDQQYMWKPEEWGELTDIEDKDTNQGTQRKVLNYGKLGPELFRQRMSESRVMVGIGRPWWSPSPYDALCLGVPFINPILHWNKDKPWDKKEWSSQHPSLVRYDPPYVYNVHADNWESFLKALKAAMSTPIERFIPPHMKESAVRARLSTLMETDWKTRAAILLEERQKEVQEGKQGVYVFEL